MSFCTKCGNQLDDSARFCTVCGQPVGNAMVPAAPQVLSPVTVSDYTGKEHRFSFAGETLVISPEMDVFNHYRKVFHKLARFHQARLYTDYCTYIKDLDAYLTHFAEMYTIHRQPLLDAAMGVFAQKNIFDISPEQFADQHTEDFCLCKEDMDTMIESFNLTIEANQDRKIRMYNMMPGMVFRGLGGLAAALAVNVAFNAIAEADIKKANVSSAQRAELFKRIDPAILMERAYIDYWRVFLSLTWELKQRGWGVWYPNEQDNARAEGLYQNLASGRVPAAIVPSQIILLLQANPYADEYMEYMKRQYGADEEAQAIIKYFGLD